MQEYYFLFALAFVWMAFAVVQDLRKREISNWLNFSLIAFALGYRVFYSVFTENLSFLLYGIGGVLFFVLIGYLFYYLGVFAGGDAKLLFGVGAILPYSSLRDYVFNGFGFVVILFLGGIVYTLVYSIFLVAKNYDKFSAEFNKGFYRLKGYFYFVFLLSVVMGFVLYASGFGVISFYFLSFVLFFLVYIYSKSLERACMIKLVNAMNLTEGDWLEKDVKAGRRWIRKSVHGLSLEEIKLLRKARKKVWVKDGVPFSPAFLIALLVFVWFWSKGIFGEF